MEQVFIIIISRHYLKVSVIQVIVIISLIDFCNYLGLFHRGYSQSGTALNPWAFQEASLDKAKRLAVSVGCPIDTSLNLIHCLKSRSAYSITEAVKHFFGYGVLPFSPFGPVIEKKHDGAFITEHPYKMLVNHQVADIPWITSVTEREGIFPGACK